MILDEYAMYLRRVRKRRESTVSPRLLVLIAGKMELSFSSEPACCCTHSGFISIAGYEDGVY